MTSITRRPRQPDGPPQDRPVGDVEETPGDALLDELLIEV